MKRLHSSLVVVAVAVFGGCGTQSPSSNSLGNASVTGAVSGYPADFDNVVAVISSSDSGTTVYLTTVSNGCDAPSHFITPNATTMELYASGTAGTYEFSYQNYEMGEAYFHVLDDDGNDVLDTVVGTSILNAADSGTIVLQPPTASAIDGTFDLAFPRGRLTGSFTAADCSSESNL